MNIQLRFSKHCWQYPILVMLHEKARSSRPEVFCKNGVFENFVNQRCFPVNCANTFLRTLFFGTPSVAASVKAYNFTKIRFCQVCFCELFKNFWIVFLMRCKNFLKVHKNTGKNMFAKSLCR